LEALLWKAMWKIQAWPFWYGCSKTVKIPVWITGLCLKNFLKSSSIFTPQFDEELNRLSSDNRLLVDGRETTDKRLLLG
jgi:hypothetical protein